MSVQGGTNNQAKALGGNNPIKLRGGAGDANNSISGWFEAPQSGSAPLSRFYRRTDKNLIKTDFDFNGNNEFVPDATENATVATSGQISFSDFRGANDQGVIKQYEVIQQSGTIDNNLDIDTSSYWNSNLDKNVPKVVRVQGRVQSNRASAAPDHSGANYNHKTGAALAFDAEAYNLQIRVESAYGSASNYHNNAAGVFGGGGGGGNVANGSGGKGGTAMYVKQNSNRSGQSAKILVNSGNGRLFGGGGGGEGGRNGTAGNQANCRFFTNPGTKYRIENNWDNTIRSNKKCNNKPKAGCPDNFTKYGITGQPNTLALSHCCNKHAKTACVGAGGGRSRCRKHGRSRGNAGEIGCFKQIDKYCRFRHKYKGNTPSGGAGGPGGQGEGANNPAQLGTVGGAGVKSNCYDPAAAAGEGSHAFETVKAGNTSNNGVTGGNGGAWGQSGGSNSRTGTQGASGHAVYRADSYSQVDVNPSPNMVGLT